MTERTLAEEFRLMGLLSEEDEAELAALNENTELLDDEAGEVLDERAVRQRTSSGGTRVVHKQTGSAAAASARARKKDKAGKRDKARWERKHKAKRARQAKRLRGRGMDDDEMPEDGDEGMDMADLGRQVQKKGESADRLDSLMGELQNLSARFQTVAEEEDIDEDVALAQRIYSNVARVADALSQRVDESDELFAKFDELADDALQIAEALADGRVTDLQKVIDAIPGYVRDLVSSVGEVSEELDAELTGDVVEADDDLDLDLDDTFEDDDEDSVPSPW